MNLTKTVYPNITAHCVLILLKVLFDNVIKESQKKGLTINYLRQNAWLLAKQTNQVMCYLLGMLKKQTSIEVWVVLEQTTKKRDKGTKIEETINFAQFPYNFYLECVCYLKI